MEKSYLSKQSQPYLPFILIAATVLLGGFLLINKGIISLPSFFQKEKIVDIEKPVVDILFSGQEYKLSYAEKQPSNFINIAKFDKNEQWRGAGSIDESKVLRGNILSLLDRDRRKAISYLVKDFNLSGIDIIKFAVNLRTDPEELESLNLLFGDKEGSSFFRFPLTNLEEGINYLSIPKYRFFLVEPEKVGVKEEAEETKQESNAVRWDNIGRVQIELISRPEGKANVEVGWIRGEKEDFFTPEWNWDQEENFLNLDLTADGKLTLFAQNVGRSVATLKKVGSVKNFIYSAQLTSLKKGFIGLFFRGDYKTGYGYYLSVGGLGTNEWSMAKFHVKDKKPTTTILVNGQIANFEFSKDQPFWLKVSAQGNTIIAYLSLNGQDYTKLGEVKDNEFEAGGVGLATSNGGAGYFDDFYLVNK